MLAAIWFEKKEFVLKAANMHQDESVFLWIDAGCIRNDEAERVLQRYGVGQYNLTPRVAGTSPMATRINDGRLHLYNMQGKVHVTGKYLYGLSDEAVF